TQRPPMTSARSVGCTTHLLIIGALLGAVIGYGIVQNLDTVSLMVDNLTIMNEQAAQADALRSTTALVEYLAAHPDRASLVAYDVGARDEGIFYGAGEPRPLTGVPRLLLLGEYARRVETGRLTPSTRVSLDSVGLYALPGSSRRPHRRARSQLVAQGRVGPDSTTALRHLVRSAFRRDDPAAADWLLRRLGRPALRQTPD
ncbi:MAG: serine hydrolase, partial [Salinivenus sp.]